MASTPASAEKPKKAAPFRATKDQIIETQNLLKLKSMYTGEANGKLDDATRDGLKKYQESNGLKVTGTLNQATLEKMGIKLTDGQKAARRPLPRHQLTNNLISILSKRLRNGPFFSSGLQVLTISVTIRRDSPLVSKRNL